MKADLIVNMLKKASDSNWYFRVGYEFQTSVLSSFNEPCNDFERSFFQYRCQRYRYSLVYRLMLNVVSFCILPFRFYGKRATSAFLEKETGRRAAFLCMGVDGTILPESLKRSYDAINEYPYTSESAVSAWDLKYFRENVWRHYWTHPYFCLKLFMRMGCYSRIINTGRFAAIISHCEYSFASSFLTAYCRARNVEHINVMHGEKLFDITDAFFHFDKCYVWNAHYKMLFCDLRAEPTQFVIEKPICQSPWNIETVQKTFDYTYYLGGESRAKMLAIRDSLSTLKAAGYTIAVRPHPRYNSLVEVHKLFNGYNVEDSRQASIRDSIARTKNAVSLCSTVLKQAQENGVNIVIDDVTDKKDYAQLTSLRYYYISLPHDKLSNHIAKCSKSGLQEARR